MIRRRFLHPSHARRFRLAQRIYAGAPSQPAVLAPLAALWEAASRLQIAARSAAQVALDRPVLSVGGIGLGGSGKTPFVRWLARALAREGRSAAVLTRGYGWVGARGPALALVPARAAVAGSLSSARVPDEARLYLRDGFAVGAHPRRASAAAALARLGVRPDVWLLDDGFQHRQLRRDRDLVLIAARELGAPRRGLPAGPFREAWRALARADRLAITGLDPGSARALAGVNRRDLGLPPGPPPVLAGNVWGGSVELEGWLAGEELDAGAPAGGPCVAFSGIADPLGFERLLLARGLAVRAHVVFPDHHRYDASDRARLLALRPAGGTLLTTEKDAARLASGWAPPGACRVVRAELRLWRGEEELVEDLRRLARA